MAKNKEFQVRYEYLHIVSVWDDGRNGGKDIRKTDSDTPVQISDYEAIKAALLAAINDPERLKAILQSEFIYPPMLSTRTQVPHDTFPEQYMRVPVFYPPIRFPVSPGYTFAAVSSAYSYNLVENPNFGFGQRDTYTYATYKVAPVLEELVLNHGDDFRSLLEAAPEESKKHLLDFTDIDLTGATIADLDPSLMNFTRSNLQHTPGITSAFLDASITYVDAKLPRGITPFWTVEKKERVLAQLAHLAEYGHSLTRSNQGEAKNKGQLVVKLAQDLTEKILATTQYNDAFQQDFLSTLHQHDKAFNTKRDHGLKMMISNIALCILGLGIGYLAAGLAHYRQTGRFAFFARTETEQQVAGIQEAICPRISM